MKTITIITAAVTCALLSSCAGLSGTTIEFTDAGVKIQPPQVPIVIPVK
jgi:hypothetical protein